MHGLRAAVAGGDYKADGEGAVRFLWSRLGVTHQRRAPVLQPLRPLRSRTAGLSRHRIEISMIKASRRGGWGRCRAGPRAPPRRANQPTTALIDNEAIERRRGRGAGDVARRRKPKVPT